VEDVAIELTRNVFEFAPGKTFFVGKFISRQQVHSIACCNKILWKYNWYKDKVIQTQPMVAGYRAD
jgi:hypothetical protein